VLKIAVIAGAILIIAVFVILIIRSGRRNSQQAFPVLIEKTLKKRGWRVPIWIDAWSRFIVLTPMSRLFRQVEWLEKFLRIPVRTSATPSERAHRLIAALPEGRTRPKPCWTVPEGTVQPATGDVEAAKAAMQELWKLAVKERVRAFGARFKPGENPRRPAAWQNQVSRSR